MKLDLLKTSADSLFFIRKLIIVLALCALGLARASAVTIDASYSTGSDVPVKASDFTATGKTVNITLNFAPTPGKQLTVVRNTGDRFIGNFSNLAQGQIVNLSFAGKSYSFVANYFGGSGHDLVLLWTNADDLAAGVASKLDSQVTLAVKQTRGLAPFDQATTLKPDLNMVDGDRALVDIQGNISQELLDRIGLLGGNVVPRSVTATTFRAAVPLSQIETVAARSDVTSISAAVITVTSRIKVPPR